MSNTEQQKLTRSYKKQLEDELNRRKNDDREKIKIAIKEAREQGDLSENADYAAAREDQSANEARIIEIEEILKHAIIVDEQKVKVLYVDLNREEEYTICGSESNPFERKISSDSPLAKAVFNHKAGEIVYMNTESGKEIKLKLISIE